MSTPIFSVRGLVKDYDDKTVLRGLDFDVHRGESLVILGRSGSGKSVMLRQLNGLEKPDGGTVAFDGTEISSMQEKDLYPIRRRIGMLEEALGEEVPDSSIEVGRVDPPRTLFRTLDLVGHQKHGVALCLEAVHIHGRRYHWCTDQDGQIVGVHVAPWINVGQRRAAVPPR